MTREAKQPDRTGDERWRELAHLAAVVLTVGLLTGLSPACGGGDNGGGTSTTPCLQYESSGVPNGISVTTVDGDSGECDFLFVDLIVHDVQDLYTANIVATYPSSVVRFSSATGLDSVLTLDNTAVDVEVRVTGSGEVTLAITRVGADAGVNVDAAGAKLIRLVFTRVGSSGSGDLAFTTGELIDSGDPPQQIPPQQIPIPITSWFGGTIGIIQI